LPTHGSLSKAGKVRQQTPKLEKTSRQKGKGPRIANKRKFEKRFGDKKKEIKIRGKRRNA